MEEIGEVYRRRYWEARYLEEVQGLKRTAQEHGLSLVTAAVAWTLANPAVSAAISGASKPEQLADHLRASAIELPATLRERLDRVWYELPRRPPDLDSPRLSDFHGVDI